jgi:Na+-driven multidrug efflux pump
MMAIFKMGIYPTIGMIFYPAYLIWNASVLSSIDSRLVAAFGLGSSISSMLLLSVGLAFNGSLGTLMPQAFGQKNYRLMGLYLNR